MFKLRSTGLMSGLGRCVPGTLSYLVASACSGFGRQCKFILHVGLHAALGPAASLMVLLSNSSAGAFASRGRGLGEFYSSYGFPAAPVSTTRVKFPFGLKPVSSDNLALHVLEVFLTIAT